MSLDTTVPRSRRALLAAGLGAAVATVASALGRPSPALAGSDGDVVLGAMNTETSTTTIRNTTNANSVLNVANTTTGPALVADSTGHDGIRASTAAANQSGVYGVTTDQMGFGVFGRNAVGQTTGALGHFQAGVYGKGGYGVWGDSDFGFGVLGGSNSDCGVGGSSYSSTSPGVYGVNIGGSTGVQGYSGPTTMPRPAAPAKTGVHGYAAQDATAVGVKGESTSGTGVYATATTGTALDVHGKAKFSRAKRVTIGAGKSSLKVTLAGVTTASLVFAVLHSNRSGVYVRAVIPATGYFTIYLNKAVTSSTYVAYFVVN